MLTPLQNLPPKVREKIQKYLSQYGYSIGNSGKMYDFGDYGVPEPAVIGLLTAWLESEGCRWERREYVVWYIFYEKWHAGDTFWQAFEKVTKIMETEI